LLCWSAVVVVALGAAENTRPIIGVLTQPATGALAKYGASYIAAGYVKWLESAGARVVPIHHTLAEADVETLVRRLNGVLFPGGGVEFAGHYWAVVTTIVRTVRALNTAGVHMPLWGTCLGFEELVCAIAEDAACLDTGLDSEDLLIPLDVTPVARKSKLFATATNDVFGILSTENTTHNNHVCGIATKRFENNKKLMAFFDVLSTNNDRRGFNFVSTIESKTMPIYGLQWHPEKVPFEWGPAWINHSGRSVLANGWTAQFFVSEARKNANKFPDAKTEEASLIYNWQPVYTAKVSSSFTQCYFF
jgi:gamma-glutamyl hydrolase